MTGNAPAFTMPPPAAVEPGRPVWPLWGVYGIGVISGLAILAGSVAPTVAQAPVLAVAAVVLFGAFGGVCAWLVDKIPYFWPSSRETMTLAVLWGAAVAIGYALIANLAIYEHVADREDGPAWSTFAPFTEEPVKDLGIVVVLLLAATRPRTALDGLVVGSFVGLGFEVVENVVQSLNNAIAAAPAGHPAQWQSLATDVLHEVLRRSWTGHIVITGIAGFGIGYAMTAGQRPVLHRWAVALGLAMLAFGGHLLWNSHRFGMLYVVGQFGLLAVYLWLIRVGRTYEARLYRPYLECVNPRLRSTSPDRHDRTRRKTIARLAGAIANGDTGQANAYADKLG